MKKYQSISLLLALFQVTLSADGRDDRFPTFDLTAVNEVSEMHPLETDSGQTLHLIDFYGKDISWMMSAIGLPDKVSGILYHGDYDIYHIPCLAGILDLYRMEEVGVKIYFWEKSGLHVFCVRDGELFSSYPCGLTRFYSKQFYTTLEKKLSVERWIASLSGDSGWRILSWWISPRIEGNGSQAIYKPIHQFPSDNLFVYYSSSVHSDTKEHIVRNRIKGSGEFLERFRFDNFSDFYFRTLLIGHMLDGNDNTLALQDIAGIEYRNFLSRFGTPDYETVSLELTVPDNSFSETWVLQKMLPQAQDALFPMRICVYEKDGFQLRLYFMRDDSDLMLERKEIEITTDEYLYAASLFRDKRNWRLIYADIIPANPEYWPQIE